MDGWMDGWMDGFGVCSNTALPCLHVRRVFPNSNSIFIFRQRKILQNQRKRATVAKARKVRKKYPTILTKIRMKMKSQILTKVKVKKKKNCRKKANRHNRTKTKM
jgi:hypothetical protein